MAHAYDKKVKPKDFKEGYLVLKKILTFKDDQHNNFNPNNEGPYLLNQVLSGAALILSEIDGDILHEPSNSDFTKDILCNVHSHSFVERKGTIFFSILNNHFIV